MFCGSIASTYYGMPRITQDVDLVVDLRQEDIPRLLAAFPEDEYYVSEEAVREAVRRRTQFNIIDFRTDWKADLIVRRARPSASKNCYDVNAWRSSGSRCGWRRPRTRYLPNSSGRRFRTRSARSEM